MENAKFIAIIYVGIEHSLEYANYSGYGVQVADSPNGSVFANPATMAVIYTMGYTAMPTFMFCAGAVSSTDLSASAVKRQFVGLLLPGLLSSPLLTQGATSFFTQLAFILGFTTTGFDGFGGMPWFLTALFLMRVVVLPTLGNMRTVPLICCVALGYAVYVLSHAGPELLKPSDNGRGNYSETLVFIHWFFAGFLASRHGLFKAFIEWARRNPRPYTLLRALSFACWVGLWCLAIFRFGTLSSLSNAYVTGCGRDSLRSALESGPAADSSVLWQHFDRLGCVAVDLVYQFLYFCANVLWLPLGVVPIFTAAGVRTLGGYLFGGFVCPFSCLAATRALTAAFHLEPWPAPLFMLVVISTCTLMSAVICSSWFQWALSPILSPMWFLPLLDKTAAASSFVPAPPNFIGGLQPLHKTALWLAVLIVQTMLVHTLYLISPKGDNMAP
jgi:hypothetical protein